MYSQTLRSIQREQFSVEIGLYSYGPCLRPGILPPGTTIGRYCSFGPGLIVYRRNHPKERLSLHPLFYNPTLGAVAKDTLPAVASNPLAIGHDVWTGSGIVILANCRRVGNGAIIGAGAVVTRDVPDFAIVAGNPARPIGQRFSPEIQALVTRSAWWMLTLEDLADSIPRFAEAVTPELIDRIRARRS